MTIVSTRCIAVTGMTCDHCASAVRTEISKLPGVTAVDVDVTAGTVRVCGDPLPGDAPLREAVEEAGYEFAGYASLSWRVQQRIGPLSPLTWRPSGVSQ
jgi:copper chaperone